MRLIVIVVSYNTAHLLVEMFASLQRAAGGLDLNCVVVDNASRDESVAIMRREFPQHRLIANRVNVGFGRANNQALPYADGRYVLLLNTDAFVAPDTLEKTVAYMEAHPRCGVLGVRLVGRDGALQPSCRFFPTPWNLFLQRTGLKILFRGARMVDDLDWDHASVRSCDWVPGCYYLVRKEVIDQVGLFDPRYFLYYEEIDHCRAVKKAGWEVVFYPDTSVVHIGGESTKSDHSLTTGGRQAEALRIESELLYFRKNHGRAGVWAGVLLSTLGSLITVVWRLLARKSPAGLRLHALRTRLLWSLFWRTGCGVSPTH